MEWTTGDEVEFVENLGKNKWSNRTCNDRYESLLKYATAANQRHEWGDVDKKFVIGLAKKLLKRRERWAGVRGEKKKRGAKK